MPTSAMELSSSNGFSLDHYFQAVRHTELTPLSGRVIRVVGLLIESDGPQRVRLECGQGSRRESSLGEESARRCCVGTDVGVVRDGRRHGCENGAPCSAQISSCVVTNRGIARKCSAKELRKWSRH